MGQLLHEFMHTFGKYNFRSNIHPNEEGITLKDCKLCYGR